jgi:hypothetical protein
MKSDYSKTTQHFRRAMVIGNGICCLLGCAIIIVGIYLIVEQIQFIPSVYGTQLPATSCYLIISAGCILFLLSFIGCFGSLFENKTLLLLYAIVLALVFVVGVLASVIAIVFRLWVYDVLKIYMKESLLTTYGYTMDNEWNNFVTRNWDEIQENFQCCGIDNQGWLLYRQTFWYKDLPGLQEVDKPYVPASCCVKDKTGAYLDQTLCQYNMIGPPGLPTVFVPRGYVNKAIYYQGCFDAGKNVLFKINNYFIAIGFILSAIVVAGIFCALVLYNSF